MSLINTHPFSLLSSQSPFSWTHQSILVSIYHISLWKHVLESGYTSNNDPFSLTGQIFPMKQMFKIPPKWTLAHGNEQCSQQGFVLSLFAEPFLASQCTALWFCKQYLQIPSGSFIFKLPITGTRVWIVCQSIVLDLRFFIQFHYSGKLSGMTWWSARTRRPGGILCLSWENAKILESGFDLVAQCGTGTH